VDSCMSYAGLAFDGNSSIIVNYRDDSRRVFGSLATEGAGACIMTLVLQPTMVLLWTGLSLSA